MIAVVNNYFFLAKKSSKRVYIKTDSSGKWSDPGNFSKPQFVIF